MRNCLAAVSRAMFAPAICILRMAAARGIDIVVSSHDPLKELEKAGQKTGGDDNDKNKRRRTKEKAPRPSWHGLRGKQRKAVRPR
jgi:hypothetical protein